jgi:urease subunit gamma/beta
MRLTAWEEERLLVFSAAGLARRRRERGLRLNAPEAVALICDAMLEAGRAGAGLDEVAAAGRGAVRPDEVLDGVRELVDEVRLEVLLDDGTRLIVLTDPLGDGRPAADRGPGAVVPRAEGPDDIENALGRRARRRLVVRNSSRRVVRVSSHFPFERVNARLAFDREAAAGFRLDLPAGASERWAPGEEKEVSLVAYGSPGPATPDR